MIRALELYRYRTLFLFFVLLYKLLLNGFYLQFSSYFEYYGVIYLPHGSAVRSLIWLLVAVAAMVTPVKVERASSALHGFLFLFCLIPASVYVELNSDIPIGFFFGLLSVFMLAPVMSRAFSLATSTWVRALNFRSFTAVYVFLSVAVLLVLVNSFGIKLSIPSISTIYNQREIYHASAGKLDKYFFDWLVNSLNVVLLILSMRKRSLILFVISILITIYLFSLGGHKGALLLGPFTLCIYLLYAFTKERFILGFIAGLVCVISLGFSYDKLMGLEYSSFSSVLIRRGLLLPSQIYYHYCDFFSHNTLNYFSQNFPFKLFMPSPYSATLANVVGSEYFTFKEGIYANGNVFADAFANVGYFAYPLSLIVLSGFYAFVDWLAKGRDMLVAVPLIFISSHTFLNTGFIVSFITHGLFLSLILLVLYPHASTDRNKRVLSSN